MYTSEFSSINPNSIQTGGVQTWSFLGDLNNNGRAERNELGVLRSQFVPRSNSIDPNLKDPKNDEIMFAFQRELATNWSFNVDWIQRWFSDMTTDQNCYGLPCDRSRRTVYTQNRVVDRLRSRQPARHRATTAADVLRRQAGVPRARTRSSTPTAATTSSIDCVQRYKALEMSVGKRMSNRWQMQGSYVWSQLDGVQQGLSTSTTTLRPDGFSTTPTRTTCSTSSASGRGANDQPHAFKLLGSYQAAWGINVGANYQALSGLPRDRTLTVPFAQGSRSVPVEARGTYRDSTPQPAVAARATRASASAAAAAPRSSSRCTTC